MRLPASGAHEGSRRGDKGQWAGGCPRPHLPADPAFVSLWSFGRDGAQCPAGWPTGGTGVRVHAPLLHGSQGKAFE